MPCTSPVSGATVVREVRRGFELHAPDDSDRDGLFDRWELRYGLDPDDPADALADPDDDGLDNLGELHFATDPLDSDTDGGGESDGSEVASGLNPRDRADDRMSRPHLEAEAANGLVTVRLGMATDGVAVDIERSADPSGPFTPLARTGLGETVFVAMGLVNDVPVCYRAHAIIGRVVSGWSAPACSLPRLDPDPPVVAVVRITPGAGPKKMVVRLSLDDSDTHGDRLDLELDRGVESSGLSDMRVDVSPSFAHTSWQPVTSAFKVKAKWGHGPGKRKVKIDWDPEARELEVKLQHLDATSLYVQARDAAGNESDIFSVMVELP